MVLFDCMYCLKRCIDQRARPQTAEHISSSMFLCSNACIMNPNYLIMIVIDCLPISLIVRRFRRLTIIVFTVSLAKGATGDNRLNVYLLGLGMHVFLYDLLSLYDDVHWCSYEFIDALEILDDIIDLPMHFFGQRA